MGGSAVADAVARARRLKGLGVGLHITVADGVPVLPRRNAWGLIGKDGRFIDNLAWAGLRWFASSRIRNQLAEEIDAQFEAFAATGLLLDHVNVHKHLHIHPTVARLVIGIGRRYGMLALRIPDEPRAVVMAAEPGRTIPHRLYKPLLNRLRRHAARSRVVCNDAVFGLAWSGAMTEQRLLSLIPVLPPGLSELYTHPATAEASAMPHAVPSYSYLQELEALTSPAVRAAINAAGIVLTRYSACGAGPAAPA